MLPLLDLEVTMERIIRFSGFVLLMEVAAAICIKLAGGQPFGELTGWNGLFALIGLVLFVVAFLIVAYTIVFGQFSQLVGWCIIGGLLISAVIMVAIVDIVGLGWLGFLQTIGGLWQWWPFVIAGACAIAWFAKLSKR